MKSPANLPLKRIIVAVVFSILVHGLLLWQLPKPDLAFIDEQLPQLQAKLEPLPKLAKTPLAHKPKIKRTTAPEVLAEPVISVTGKAEIAASVPADTKPAASSAPLATEPLAPTLPSSTEESFTPPLLPKHAQLHFSVQYGSGTFKVGEVIHTLKNIDGHYILRSETQTTGLVSIFKSYHLTQTSTGLTSTSGLQPENYAEAKTDRSGTQITTTRFDWKRHTIHFANGQESILPEQAQDVLSLPYHLSQLPLNVASRQIALSKGNNINQYYIATGDEVSISTAMGNLRTITLSKVHGANEDGLIIWLALEYRLLPVKILYLDKSGAVSANMVITDIRVSDE